jgi:hypothetical protein
MTAALAAKATDLRRLVARVHSLGPRPLYELICEVLAGADLCARLERYAELDPAICKYLGASEFPTYQRETTTGPGERTSRDEDT